MTQKELDALYGAFEPLFKRESKDSHVDLIQIYYIGINLIKNNFKDKSRELKAAALFYIKQQTNKLGLIGMVLEEKEITISKMIIDFFDMYDKKFETFRDSFELVTDDDYLLLSFVYRNS